VHRRRFDLAFFHAEIGQDLLDVSLLVQRYRPIIMVVELDPKEGMWGSQIIHLELRFKGILDIHDFLFAGCHYEEIIHIHTDDAVLVVKHTVVRFGHGKAMSDQNSLDTPIPNSRGLFEAVERSTETTDISFLDKSFGKFHVDRRVSVTMKEGCLGIQMSQLPA